MSPNRNVLFSHKSHWQIFHFLLIKGLYYFLATIGGCKQRAKCTVLGLIMPGSFAVGWLKCKNKTQQKCVSYKSLKCCLSETKMNECETQVFISFNSPPALIPLRDLFAAKWTRSREHAVTTKFALDSRAWINYQQPLSHILPSPLCL